MAETVRRERAQEGGRNQKKMELFRVEVPASPWPTPMSSAPNCVKAKDAHDLMTCLICTDSYSFNILT